MKEFLQNEIIRYSAPEKISNHLWLQYILSGSAIEKDYRWSVHIVVDDLTTAKELRETWGKVDIARSQLRKQYGSDPKQFSLSLMSKLIEQKKTDSYKTLATDLNFDVLTYLFWLTDESKGIEVQTLGRLIFDNLFVTLGFKKKDIKVYEDLGRNQIVCGKTPWILSEQPITTNKVVHAIEQFKYEIKSEKVVLGPSFNTFHIENIWKFANTNGYWMMAKDLLQKERPDEFEKYSKRFDLRLAALGQALFRKSGLNAE